MTTLPLNKAKEWMENDILGDYLDEILVMAALMDYEVQQNSFWGFYAAFLELKFHKGSIYKFTLRMEFEDSHLLTVTFRTLGSGKKHSEQIASHHTVLAKTLEMLN